MSKLSDCGQQLMDALDQVGDVSRYVEAGHECVSVQIDTGPRDLLLLGAELQRRMPGLAPTLALRAQSMVRDLSMVVYWPEVKWPG